MNTKGTWERFQKYYRPFPELGLALDISRMDFDEAFLQRMESPMQRAFEAMQKLEAGAIANQDEKRMVGHYWLRSPALAPNLNIRAEIENTVSRIKTFAADIHSGRIAGPLGPFDTFLLIGIGGSALGPQFVSKALGSGADKMRAYFIDNTDPDGIDNVLSGVPDKSQCLVIVVSKSGGTKETRNGMLEVQNAFKAANLDFNRQAVAITSEGSALDKLAQEQKWLARFPMWDWVGGRTSELSAVGLLPAALQGIDIAGLLSGASACDEVTRRTETVQNPAALLALMWYCAGEGVGKKNMVVLPYKDRLELFSKYLQQLLMESLGKEFDRSGKRVNQGITVLGNKGATDQHSYIQQLREGLSNFFVVFIEVLKDRIGDRFEVEPQVTSGDYLDGFYLGTRQALYENGRQSLTITVDTVNSRTIGMLIALFERATGLYAELINVNAYHQPGVEAGKKAAGRVIDLQLQVLNAFSRQAHTPSDISSLGKAIGSDVDLETLFKICEHLAANGRIQKVDGASPLESRYSLA